MDYLIELGISKKTVSLINKKYPAVIIEQLILEKKNVIENIKKLKRIKITKIEEILLSHIDIFIKDSSDVEDIFNNYNLIEISKEINSDINILNYM